MAFSSTTPQILVENENVLPTRFIVPVFCCTSHNKVLIPVSTEKRTNKHPPIAYLYSQHFVYKSFDKPLLTLHPSLSEHIFCQTLISNSMNLRCRTSHPSSMLKMFPRKIYRWPRFAVFFDHYYSSSYTPINLLNL